MEMTWARTPSFGSNFTLGICVFPRQVSPPIPVCPLPIYWRLNRPAGTLESGFLSTLLLPWACGEVQTHDHLTSEALGWGQKTLPWWPSAPSSLRTTRLDDLSDSSSPNHSEKLKLPQLNLNKVSQFCHSSLDPTWTSSAGSLICPCQHTTL